MLWDMGKDGEEEQERLKKYTTFFEGGDQHFVYCVNLAIVLLDTHTQHLLIIHFDDQS